LAKTVTCTNCDGSGGEKEAGSTRCDQCNGAGQIHETRNSILGTMTSVRECAQCHGDGQIPKKKCRECGGFGILKRQEEISVVVPPGIRSGEVIRLSGQGEAIVRGATGDLYVKIHVESDPVFRRENNNIVIDLDIKLTDALLGGVYTIPTIDGTTIELKVPAGASFGEILRVRGRGVPIDARRRGDMLIKLRIKLPKRLSRRAKKLFDQLKEEGI